MSSPLGDQMYSTPSAHDKRPWVPQERRMRCSVSETFRSSGHERHTQKKTPGSKLSFATVLNAHIIEKLVGGIFSSGLTAFLGFSDSLGYPDSAALPCWLGEGRILRGGPEGTRDCSWATIKHPGGEGGPQMDNN
uniref:Uncharacterized protein n=1 Tax=Eutreptiella gymnastica TaxID=73025 RepID=A0A7S1I3T6_9EUGL|mmetsp:Transcript_128046/g.221237  ORF Transcript_128046/g.221237 Transcript_128046/m.221237 type:complete len:135 (+) Transcript_128046:802-1206(+)